MNEMLLWEINDIIDNLDYTDRNSWEQCKINSYILALVNSRKKIEKESFMRFKWNKETEEHNYEISNEDIERLKRLSKKYEKSNT